MSEWGGWVSGWIGWVNGRSGWVSRMEWMGRVDG